MRMTVYVKDEKINNIELDMNIVECYVLKCALEDYIANEDYNAIDRAPAAEMLRVIAEERELIDIGDLS